MEKVMECKKSNVTFEADAALKLEKEACMEGELLYNLCNSCSSVADLVHFFQIRLAQKDRFCILILLRCVFDVDQNK